MSDVVEKMARAIWAAQHQGKYRPESWAGIWRAPEVRWPYAAAAVAALDALAESVSDEMVDASQYAMAEKMGTHYEPSAFARSLIAPGIRAAILAAKGRG